MKQWDEEQTMSRQEKLMAAKAAFGQTHTIRSTATPGMWKSTGETGGSGQEEPEAGISGKNFGLLRFMTAGMLLLLLIAAFGQGFSYQGFDRGYVQEKLNDETSWNRLEQREQQVYFSLEEQWKQNNTK